MEIRQCILTNNDCYKSAQKINPVGIVVHSTGANNPNLKRYVQPDDGLLGVNTNNNDWNRGGIETCVHAFIGKDKNGVVRCYQTLPFDIASWGVGRGSNGSYNYNPMGHIQFEICEDGLTDENYFNQAFALAEDFCVYLCKTYGLSVDSIVSHKEAHDRGYGSNHGDCDHWLNRFGKTMNDFRSNVAKKMGSSYTPPTKPSTPSTNGGGKLFLPATAKSWRVYPLNKQPVVGNECGYLYPSKFGGLIYDVLRYTQPDVAVIKTRDYGEVQIYVAKSTGAIISGSNSGSNGSTSAQIGKKLYLPSTAKKWRVYPLNKQPVVGNECGLLYPSKFGGLTYDIIARPMNNVVTIQTRDYGKVNIYVAPSTGAIIK